MNDRSRPFGIDDPIPDGFVWGVATSAYQIEGAVHEEGRGESIWDRFSHTPGRVFDGHNGDVACDHYHRWREDVGLLSELGLDAYRLSIAWPRIVPEGRGAVNSAGLDFYDRLVDELLAAGIEPFVTLYHWDLPQVLADEGGWTARPTAEAFAEYASVVAERLGDRVVRWFTINEPWCVAELGYRSGIHAPGWSDPGAALTASHHVLLAHGLGMAAVRSVSSSARIGVVLNMDSVEPRSQHPADLAAARRVDDVRNRWYADPVLLGRYPAEAVADREWDQACVREGDLEIISAPMDHLGVNYYTRLVAADDAVADAERPTPLNKTDRPRTTMGWEVYPQGMYDLLMWCQREYQLPPVYISENGVAYPDTLVDGAVHDADRIQYLADHMAAAMEARADGVPLQGYFVWSLLDNFEWQHGYSQRFGLVWTDYATQERIVKDSGRWLADQIRHSR